MNLLRRPIPSVALLTLGLVGCNDDSPFIGGGVDAGTIGDTGGTGSGPDVGSVGRDTGGDGGGSDASTGSDAAVGSDATTGTDASGSDTSTGADSTSRPDTGTGTDTGSSDTGSTDVGGDSGGEGGVTLAEVIEVAFALCAREATCNEDPDYLAECEADVEEYAGDYLEYLNHYGADCGRAYLEYMECLAESGTCVTDEEGYTYLDGEIACADEQASAETICGFDDEEDDGPPVP